MITFCNSIVKENSKCYNNNTVLHAQLQLTILHPIPKKQLPSNTSHIKQRCLVVSSETLGDCWAHRVVRIPPHLMTQQPAIHTSIIINSKAQNISLREIDFDLNKHTVLVCEDLIVT